MMCGTVTSSVERLSAAALVCAWLATASSACNAERAAAACIQAATADECQECCKAAGRNGGTYVLDDCQCHDQ